VSEGEAKGATGGSSATYVNCQDAVHQLYDFLDGELTEARRAEIAWHLDRCRPCAKAAEFEQELRQVIAHRCRDRVPDALMERIAKALDQERQDHLGSS
jgi:mycothiol system anti-sigma-R factor